jgi:hypothetical protein
VRLMQTGHAFDHRHGKEGGGSLKFVSHPTARGEGDHLGSPGHKSIQSFFDRIEAQLRTTAAGSSKGEA